MYDIFYVSNNLVDVDRWTNFRKRFPRAQKLENITSFDQVASNSFTKFFWVVWNDLVVRDEFIFDYKIPVWDKEYIHVFRNGGYFDGVCLFPKAANISKREFEYRFFSNKKEIDIVASDPVATVHDIVFISYYEAFADKNYQALLKKVDPKRVFRVDGVKGIHKAHVEAAKLARTDMFYVVDADAEIMSTFEFDYQIPYYDKGYVYVWQSKNPVNGLVYGYGGVKLLPRKLTIAMDQTTTDMTTSISSQFRSVQEISNITAFNTDPFNSWKSAFRECCKLSSKVIARQNDTETEERLRVWCEETIDDDARRGAIEGRDYGKLNSNDKNALKNINNFDWLKDRFNARQTTN